MEYDTSMESLKPDFALGGSGSQSYGNREYAMNNNKMKKSIDRFNIFINMIIITECVFLEQVQCGVDEPSVLN